MSKTDNPVLSIVKSASVDRYVNRQIGKVGINEGRLVCYTTTRGGQEVMVPLFVNGVALIDQEIISDDGIVENKFFMMVGRSTDGRELPPIKVKTEQFQSMSWLMNSWGNRLINSVRQWQ